MMKHYHLFFLLFYLVGQQVWSQPESKIKHADWIQGASVYEVNIRQYTPEGTINAFLPHLKRLNDMGVNILWLMPIQPIGEKNRKGGLGSYYSIKDYTAINPEFGTINDFKNLVSAAHSLKMKVIIDWVANHTAWDHPWINSNPERYQKDSSGQLLSPYDWTDVVQLNYQDKGLRKAMIEAMNFWVKETNIDGFRCDVAFLVPNDFWQDARKQLEKYKPLYLLAEAELPEHHVSAFNASYAWEFLHLMNSIQKKEKELQDLEVYLQEQTVKFPTNALRLTFVTNHDENSWNGTEFERYGTNAHNFMVLAYTFHGQPLIYSGQETNLNRRLAFFEKDSIQWHHLPNQAIIRRLLHLYTQEPALAHGTSKHTSILSIRADLIEYQRKFEASNVYVALNFGHTDAFVNQLPQGLWQDVLNEKIITVTQGQRLLIPAHQSLVLRKLN